MTEQPETHAAPVVRVARDLTAIEALSRGLEEQAVHKANDRTLPGGDALAALGPVADPGQYREQFDAAEFHHHADPLRWPERTIDLEHEDEDDAHATVLNTLWWWSDDWRRRRGYPLEGRRATIKTEANFIRLSLEWVWENEGRWDAFAEDIRSARRHLENVLHAGKRDTPTRVHCTRPTCSKHPRLLLIKAPRKLVAYACRDCAARVDLDADLAHCPDPWCWSTKPPAEVWFSDPAEDRYKCPAPGCKSWYNADEYERAYARQLKSEGAERYIPKADAVLVLAAQGTPDRVVRAWLEAEGVDLVEGYCEVGSRRVFTWWPTLWRKHLMRVHERGMRKVGA